MSPLRAVLFDMDGTLLLPLLHDEGLPEFKARWNIPAHKLIIPSLPGLPLAAAEEFDVLERDMAERGEARPGVTDLLADLNRLGVHTGLVTNNSTASVQTMLERNYMPFQVTRTRADGPMKPEPDLILDALMELGAPAAQTVFVGDTAPDLGAAQAAGVRACLLLAEPWNETLGGDDGFRVHRVQGILALRPILVRYGAPAALGG